MATTGRTHRRRLGELLVSEGAITVEQLEQALEIQQESGDLIGQVLMDMGCVAEADITKALCIQYQLPFLTLTNYQYDPKLIEIFPPAFMHEHRLLPFDRLGKTLMILVGEVPEPQVLEEVPKKTNLNAALYVGYLSEVISRLNELAPLEQGQVATPTRRNKKPGPTPPKEPVIEIVPGATGDDEENAPESPLIFGDGSGSFLEELDTTWDSIFQEADGDGQDDEQGTSSES